MTLSFSEYLDAKFALDERSLNPDVRAAFRAALGGAERRACLDLGTGAGASLRRLLEMEPAADLDIVAVDRDENLLRLAQERTAAQLAGQGYTLEETAGRIRALGPDRRITVDFCVADVQDCAPPCPSGRFDAVIAHQVMDLLPLDLMAGRIAGWLRPHGVCYASLDYDGLTALFPGYRDEALETRILAVYDASMERRRVRGLPTGGARSGRRLHAALSDRGFDILAYGSSDWNLTPLRRAYRDRDAAVLEVLLELIRGEADRSGGFDPARLDAWHRDRLECLAEGRLGLIVHQIDLLAELAPPEPR
jgi:SAM-dependent methyltransferase